MITLYDDEVLRGNVKVGYLEGRRFYNMHNEEVGYYENDRIYKWNGTEIGYLEDDKIHFWDGVVFEWVEDNRRNVNRGDYSGLCCAAAALLFRD